MRLIVVGPGRVGLSLAAALAGSGRFDPIVVAGPAPAAPPFLREAAPAALYVSLGGGSGSSDGPSAGPGPAVVREPGPPAAPEPSLVGEALGAATDEAGVVFAVPDAALAASAAGWAGAVRELGRPVPAVALHTSGFHPAAALGPLTAAGASAASWHPLVALAGPRRDAFRGRTVGVEGDGRGAAVGEAMAGTVGARSVRVRPGEKPRWHAAAVLASNCLVACLSAAVRELTAASDAGAGLDDLLPLARSALEEVAGRGLADGLTGPVARGDAETVGGHLAALDPAPAALYRLLAAELLRLAAPGLDAGARRALEAALKGPAGGATGDLEPGAGG